MSVGRIESYLHSDRITPNKLGVLVKITSDTDFGAKTPEFIRFAQRVAKLAAGFIQSEDIPSWTGLVKAVGYTGEHTETLETEREALSKALKEKITVEDIVVLRL